MKNLAKKEYRICALCGRADCQEDHAQMLSKFPLFVETRKVLKACLAGFRENGIEGTHIQHPVELARALLAKLEDN